MRKPQVIIINETQAGKENLKRILKGKVKEDSGINFDIVTVDDVIHPEALRSNSRLLRGHMYFVHEDPNNRQLASKMAKVLAEKGIKGGKILTTQNKEPYKDTMTEPGYEQFSGWLPKNHDENFDEGEVIRKVCELRKEGKLFQPLSIGIVGLGTLGLGILEKAARSNNIQAAHVYTQFVNGDYSPLLTGLDLTGEQREKIITHGTNLEALIQEKPDVLLITTGKHGIDYDAFNERTELTEMLFKTGLPKIEPVLLAAIANNYPGLIAIQSNPNGHFIKYATRLGIPREQLTSFPPDTIRHRAELYEKLKEFNPAIKEEDVLTIAIGDHMKGGVPLYAESFVRVNNVFVPLFETFPQLKKEELQKEICTKAQKVGLAVVQSANKYQHDYRGVPQRVKECLEDISNLQRYSRYPIYAGLLSVPAEFVLEDSRDGNGRVDVKVKGICKITDLTENKELLLGPNELNT